MWKGRVERAGILVIAVLGIVAAACGASGGATSSDEPTPLSEGATAAPLRDEIHVKVDGTGDYVTFEAAVAAAAPQATIRLGPGIYRLVNGLNIDRSLTLVGAGMDETEIVSGAPGHVIRFTGSGAFRAEGITFRHDGTATADVVVVDGGAGYFSACRFTGAVYEEGEGNRAGLRFRGTSRGTVENSVVSDNDNTGILVEQRAQPELRGNICSDNSAVGIGYMDLATGVASGNECTGNQIGIALAVEVGPTLERNLCNDNDYGIAYLENAGGRSYENECMRNRIGIAIGGSSTVQLGENFCRDNTEEDIRDSR
ncbi:MAG: right-handed parallel beta-helix repeat-containing protein [Anaerolineae bacterium]